jgi:hypothetical protein
MGVAEKPANRPSFLRHFGSLSEVVESSLRNKGRPRWVPQPGSFGVLSRTTRLKRVGSDGF